MTQRNENGDYQEEKKDLSETSFHLKTEPADQKKIEQESKKTREQASDKLQTPHSQNKEERISSAEIDLKQKETIDKREDGLFPVIGIGASAGGLEAIEALLSNMPEESGMSFVIISHTDPDRTTMLPDILGRSSKARVSLIEENMSLEPDTVYVPPSDQDVNIRDNVFRLTKKKKMDGIHMPIDHFFKSLAEDCGDRSAGVILSGTGSDGTLGLRVIKEKAGVAVSQSPDSARYAGMPQSAINTGLIDFVLPPGKIVGELIRYFRHPGKIQVEKEVEEQPPETLEKILAFLADRVRHDFSLYKKSTVIRRIERRMSINAISNGEEYLHFLERNPDEAENLFEDMLIGVTGFFRDPEAFDFLKAQVLPGLIGESDTRNHLRFWIPGCSTGEEAYSLAIIVQEVLREKKNNRQVQIFATDIDKKAIEKARQGMYLENIASEVNSERLNRFFSRENSHYQVVKEIRESIVFAIQNVLSDPPFSNLDLLVCRNLLIYLEAEAQQKLIPLFHYTLKPGGVLFLGTSESIGRFGDLFKTENKKFSIYRRKDGHSGYFPMVQFSGKFRQASDRNDPRAKAPQPLSAREEALGLTQAMEKELLKNFTPASVIVDQDGHIHQILGRTGRYLEQPEGKPSLEIVELAREGLRFALSNALRRVNATGKQFRQEHLRVKTNGGFHEVNLIVKPLYEPGILKDKRLIVFEDLGEDLEKRSDEKSKEGSGDQNERIFDLERELAGIKRDYQGSLEEIEFTNEELRSSNEEVHSTNEELQSTNEELESSREELQSLNEELTTVNSELQARMEELAESYGTVANVLNSTRVALLFLDNDLKIKRFTEEAARLINLIDSDVGRPLAHISHNLEYGQLLEKVRRVRNTMSPFEDDVRTREGEWYRMRIMVYSAKDDFMEGIVLTFVNIDAQKRAQAEIEEMNVRDLRKEREFSESIVETIRESLLVLDQDFKVLRANRSFYQKFQIKTEEIEGKSLFEVGQGDWDIEKLRNLLQRILDENNPFEDYPVEHHFKNVGFKRMLLNAGLLREEETNRKRILLAMEDITERGPDRERKDE